MDDRRIQQGRDLSRLNPMCESLNVHITDLLDF